MCFAVVCCKVGMNYVDGGVYLWNEDENSDFMFPNTLYSDKT